MSTPTHLEDAVLHHLRIYRGATRQDLTLALAAQLNAAQAEQGIDQYRIMKNTMIRVVSRGYAESRNKRWYLTSSGYAYLAVTR